MYIVAKLSLIMYITAFHLLSSTTAFINTFLLFSHFSLIIRFKKKLQVVININEPDNSDQ